MEWPGNNLYLKVSSAEASVLLFVSVSGTHYSITISACHYDGSLLPSNLSSFLCKTEEAEKFRLTRLRKKRTNKE